MRRLEFAVRGERSVIVPVRPSALSRSTLYLRSMAVLFEMDPHERLTLDGFNGLVLVCRTFLPVVPAPPDNWAAYEGERNWGSPRFRDEHQTGENSFSRIVPARPTMQAERAGRGQRVHSRAARTTPAEMHSFVDDCERKITKDARGTLTSSTAWWTVSCGRLVRLVLGYTAHGRTIGYGRAQCDILQCEVNGPYDEDVLTRCRDRIAQVATQPAGGPLHEMLYLLGR